MAEIGLTVNEDGGALLDLAGAGGGEIRASVALDELSEGVPGLESMLPPSLLDQCG